MEENATPNPANTLNTTDPGDDIQRRFRYQAFFAAVMSLELLAENSEFLEIFCEHHEDTLIRKRDGKFIGIQVKTRASGRDLFKADDDQVIKSLARFVEQNIQFPDCFSYFIIATNYAFWNEGKSAKNLHHLLELAKGVHQEHHPIINGVLSKYIDRITKCLNERNADTIDKHTILNVLGRVRIQEDLPKFDDMESRLVKHIPECYDAGEAGLDDLLKAARVLINRMFEASALQHVSARNMYFSLFEKKAQVHADTVIAGKRITQEIVNQILRESLSNESLLAAQHPVSISALPKGMRKLEIKMATGKISAPNISRAKDFKFSTEKLLNEWIYKHNPQTANKRFDQLRMIVGNECQEAFDSKFSAQQPFGKEMLTEIRERLRRRLTTNPNLFFECTYEHLLGIVGILTEQCDVWWSEEFEIPGDVL